MNKKREHLKLHASSHRVELAVAYHEVWDAEGDLQDLVVRCSSNLRRPIERRRCPIMLHR
jgi:hypothetical protein